MEAKKRGMTQSQVAKACGRDPQWLNGVLNGGNPTVATVERIGKVFQLTACQMLEEINPTEYGQVMMSDKIKK